MGQPPEYAQLIVEMQGDVAHDQAQLQEDEATLTSDTKDCFSDLKVVRQNAANFRAYIGLGPVPVGDAG